jgi:hypothetical protein
MKINSIFLLCALAGAVGGCSGDLFHPTPADVTGTWGEEFSPTTVAGNSFLMTLTDNAGDVTGFGGYAGEAGPFGQLAVTGAYKGDSLHLRIVYVPSPTTFPQLKPDTATLDGVFTSRDRIRGTLVRFGSAQAFSVVRVQQDPVR